jgi:hypothetical protein
MSSRKPLRRTTSNRGEDDYLSRRNFLKSYTRLILDQLACKQGLCEGRAWVRSSLGFMSNFGMSDGNLVGLASQNRA